MTGWRILGLALLGTTLAACAGIQQPASTAPADDMVPMRSAGLAPTQIAALDNLSRSEILARLGQPDFTRRDPPAEIWQYRGVGCVLDLFLYPEGAGDLHVAHAVSRSPGSASMPKDSCTPFPSPKATATS